MNEAEKHLSDEQIDWLLAQQRSETEQVAPQGVLEEVRRHLVGCQKCRQAVEMHSRIERNLRELQAKSASSPSKDCPPMERLLEVGAGMKSDEGSEEVLDHATHCDYCGPLLRQATEDFVGELTSEEESLLAQLPSAQPDVQRELGRKLAVTQRPAIASKRFVFPIALDRLTATLTPTRWIYAAGALIAAAALGSWLVVRSWKPSADQLIAQAYSEQRTLELRFADARQAPIRQQRGTEGSPLSKPTALLEAEVLIKKQLLKTPSDPRWLAAKGRSELLEWRYEDAIHSFERALETNPNSPDVLRDLATAHFQRAEVDHSPIDYGLAIDELSQALARRPDDPVCLFNRAIVYERMFLYENAIKDWDSYLRVDPSGSWSGEARQHLDEIKKKIQEHNQSEVAPLEDPAAASNYFGERLRGASAADDKAGSIDEQYLDVAGEKWLSALAEDIRHGKSLQQSTPGQALQLFSTLWETHHGDSWLVDLLQSANVAGFPEAAQALSSAVTAASKGDPSLARQKAILAERLFERLPNRAGVLRAKLEETYALQRSLEDGKCLVSGRALESKLRSLSYHWIQAKLFLEASACYANTAQIEEAERYVQQSEEIASRRGFGALYMRGLSFAADFAADKGDRTLAWKRARLGLEQYWSGSYPVVRGYALCASLGYVAEDAGQGWVAIAFWSEAVPLIAKTANRSTEGLARYRLATEEISVGEKAAADNELEKVTEIFSRLPKSPASLNYRVASEVSLASIELSRGQRASAKTRLNEIGSYVPLVDQYQTALQFYRTLAEEEMTEGDWQRAEKSLHSALAIGERGLSTLVRDADRLNWDQQMSDAYRILVRLLLSQPGREEQALRVWEWHRSLPFQTAGPNHLSPTLGLAELGARPPSPGEADIRSLLPALTQVTFLTYAQLNDAIVLWAFDDRGISFRRISTPLEKVKVVSERFVRLCSDPTTDTALVQGDGKKLYEWLISPIESLLVPGRTIWVEPDGELSFIPFQALVTPDGSALLERLPVAYRGSAIGPQRVEEPHVENSDQALIATVSLLAPPSSSRALPPLPDADREAADIASLFPHHTLLLNGGATPDLLRTELRRAAIFHYAGHYVPAGGANSTVLGSALAKEPAGASTLGVRPDFLLGRCKLVVLSACATGSWEKLGLYDPDGLVRPLLRSGARRVIASRWNVDSSVTAKLMDDLYSALLSGRTSVDALRAASLRLAEDPQYRHPYYWAGFGVFAQD